MRLLLIDRVYIYDHTNYNLTFSDVSVIVIKLHFVHILIYTDHSMY